MCVYLPKTKRETCSMTILIIRIRSFPDWFLLSCARSPSTFYFLFQLLGCLFWFLMQFLCRRCHWRYQTHLYLCLMIMLVPTNYQPFLTEHLLRIFMYCFSNCYILLVGLSHSHFTRSVQHVIEDQPFLFPFC